MKVCINEECHYWDDSCMFNCDKPGVEGDMKNPYFPHCEYRIVGESENEQVNSADHIKHAPKEQEAELRFMFPRFPKV